MGLEDALENADRIAGVVSGVVAVSGAIIGSVAFARRSRRRGVIRGLAPRGTRVRQIDNPMTLGVHPAIPDPRSGGNQVPTFVVRDQFETVCRRIAGGGFVVVIGESTAGKSRLAYEAARAVVPDHHLFRADPGADLDVLADAVHRSRRAVCWLDELDQFLGTTGLTQAHVRHMLAGPRRHTVLLATMRSREYDRYSARQKESTDAATWRRGREVLLMAGDPVELDRRWSREEMARARRVVGDRRITSACEQADVLGVAEILAAGPELERDWRHGREQPDHLLGGALVAAAVDVRRMGHHRAVDRTLLMRMSENYLPGRDEVRQGPEPESDAFAWATAPVHGTSSLLLTLGEGYLAFDYLIDLPDLGPIPEASWHTLIEAVTPSECYDIGWAAVDLQRSDQALAAFDRARQHDVPDADYAYHIALGNLGSGWETITYLREQLADRERRSGPEHPRVLAVRHDLARFLSEFGRPAEAVAVLTDLAAIRHRLLGPDDPLTLRARHDLGRFTRDAGDAVAALALLDAVTADQARILGADHIDTLANRHDFAVALAAAGRLPEAIAEARSLVRDQESVLGRNHPHVLNSRCELAIMTGDAGSPMTAIQELDAVLSAQRLVQGDHPRLLHTRRHRARLRARAGDAATATVELRAVVADETKMLGADHPRTLGTRADLLTVREQAGTDVSDARADLAADCRRVLGRDHPITRRVLRDRTEA